MSDLSRLKYAEAVPLIPKRVPIAPENGLFPTFLYSATSNAHAFALILLPNCFIAA